MYVVLNPVLVLLLCHEILFENMVFNDCMISYTKIYWIFSYCRSWVTPRFAFINVLISISLYTNPYVQLGLCNRKIIEKEVLDQSLNHLNSLDTQCKWAMGKAYNPSGVKKECSFTTLSPTLDIITLENLFYFILFFFLKILFIDLTERDHK